MLAPVQPDRLQLAQRGADVDVCLALDTATLVPVYHPDVKAYEVRNRDGQPVGVLLQDNFARPSKRTAGRGRASTLAPAAAHRTPAGARRPPQCPQAGPAGARSRMHLAPLALVGVHQHLVAQAAAAACPQRAQPVDAGLLAPGIGELKFLNWAYSLMAGKLRITMRDFIAFAEELDDDVKQAVRLWEKMGAASTERPQEWMSTHPNPESRVADLKRYITEKGYATF